VDGEAKASNTPTVSLHFGTPELHSFPMKCSIALQRQLQYVQCGAYVGYIESILQTSATISVSCLRIQFEHTFHKSHVCTTTNTLQLPVILVYQNAMTLWV
jgi:hypothetical protein